MRSERIDEVTPELAEARPSADPRTSAAMVYVPSSRGAPVDPDTSAVRRPHRLGVPTLVVVAAASYAIGVLALFTQRWTVLVPAAVLFQLALVAARRAVRRTASTPGATGVRVKRSGRCVAARADAWLLAESLADLSSHPLPRPSGPDAGHHAIVSRRNRSALEFFPSEDAPRQALDQVLRRHPHLQGRFAVEDRSADVM